MNRTCCCRWSTSGFDLLCITRCFSVHHDWLLFSPLWPTTRCLTWTWTEALDHDFLFRVPATWLADLDNCTSSLFRGLSRFNARPFNWDRPLKCSCGVFQLLLSSHWTRGTDQGLHVFPHRWKLRIKNVYMVLLYSMPCCYTVNCFAQVPFIFYISTEKMLWNVNFTSWSSVRNWENLTLNWLIDGYIYANSLI